MIKPMPTTGLKLIAWPYTVAATDLCQGSLKKIPNVAFVGPWSDSHVAISSSCNSLDSPDVMPYFVQWFPTTSPYVPENNTTHTLHGITWVTGVEKCNVAYCRNKMFAVPQKTLSNESSWIEMFVFWFNFHLNICLLHKGSSLFDVMSVQNHCAWHPNTMILGQTTSHCIRTWDNSPNQC